MTTIRVKAVAGRMLPDAARKGQFVGYAECESKCAEHCVPGGKSFKAAGVVDVTDNAYHRRAVLRGDLEQVVTQAATATKEKA